MWIDLITAARRLGKSSGHVARMCREQWSGQQLAEQRKPSAGGKASWFVREDADPALAAVKFPEQIVADLRQFPATKRQAALARKAILDRWHRFISAAITLGKGRQAATNSFVETLYIEGVRGVSARTVYNWERAYRAEGLLGLIDGRGHADEDVADDPFLAEVQRLWLSVRQPKLSKVHELAAIVAADRGWVVRSYKSAQRHVAKLPAAVVLKMRGGDEAYTNNAEPFIERDYTSLDSNQMWCSDHHQFDVIVRDGTTLLRPWITAFQDIRSRKIVGWVIFGHAPNSDTIFSAFRRAAQDCGVPQELLIDNGKDYDCYALNGRTKKDRWAKRRVRVDVGERADGLFAALDIKVRHAQAYHGQSKPIERWFGEIEQRTFVWDTYCGNRTEHKPEDLQLQIERGKAPSLADFIAWADELICQYNAGHAHSGDGMEGKTPDAVWAECLSSKRVAAPELLDVLCLRKVGPVRVSQNGVTFNGLRYGQFEAAVNRLIGKEVYLRIDERDLSRVQVYDSADRFVAVATANAKLPFNADSQLLREVTQQKRGDRKTVKGYAEARPRMADDLPQRMIRVAAAKSAAAPEPGKPSPSLQPVRHALEGQLTALLSAEKRGRIAVGGESIPSKFLYPATIDRSEEPAVFAASFRSSVATTEQP